MTPGENEFDTPASLQVIVLVHRNPTHSTHLLKLSLGLPRFLTLYRKDFITQVQVIFESMFIKAGDSKTRKGLG